MEQQPNIQQIHQQTIPIAQQTDFLRSHHRDRRQPLPRTFPLLAPHEIFEQHRPRLRALPMFAPHECFEHHRPRALPMFVHPHEFFEHDRKPVLVQERVSSEATDLLEATIMSLLKTRIHCSADQNGSEGADEEPGVCAIYHDGYKNEQNFGTLDYGHEYHVDCIKAWLMRNNSCPFCRRQALEM